MDCTYSPGNDREFTYLVYLNDVEDGGQTRFTARNVTVEAKAGRLLVWRNMKDDVCLSESMHEGAPVLKGVKLVFVDWVFQFKKGTNPQTVVV